MFGFSLNIFHNVFGNEICSLASDRVFVLVGVRLRACVFADLKLSNGLIHIRIFMRWQQLCEWQKHIKFTKWHQVTQLRSNKIKMKIFAFRFVRLLFDVLFSFAGYFFSISLSSYFYTLSVLFHFFLSWFYLCVDEITNCDRQIVATATVSQVPLIEWYTFP